MLEPACIKRALDLIDCTNKYDQSTLRVVKERWEGNIWIYGTCDPSSLRVWVIK